VQVSAGFLRVSSGLHTSRAHGAIHARARSARRDIHHFTCVLSYPPPVSRACACMRVHARSRKTTSGYHN